MLYNGRLLGCYKNARIKNVLSVQFAKTLNMSQMLQGVLDFFGVFFLQACSDDSYFKILSFF